MSYSAPSAFAALFSAALSPASSRRRPALRLCPGRRRRRHRRRAARAVLRAGAGRPLSRRDLDRRLLGLERWPPRLGRRPLRARPPGYSWQPHRWEQQRRPLAPPRGPLGASLIASPRAAAPRARGRPSPPSPGATLADRRNRSIGAHAPGPSVAFGPVWRRSRTRASRTSSTPAPREPAPASLPGERATASTCAASTPPPSRSRRGDKARDKAAVDALAAELDAPAGPLLRRPPLQAARGPAGHRHQRQGRHDPRRVRPMSALGVRTVGWKAPTEEERAHDFLWRIHQRVPARRRDRRSSTAATTRTCSCRSSRAGSTTRRDAAALRPDQRLRAAADRDAAPSILKFMLHISKDEQRAAPAGAPRRPDQALEVRRRRPRRAQAAGTTTRRPTSARSARPARRGRRGRSCPPIRRRTAT